VLASHRGTKLGDSITISTEGRRSTFRVVGLVEEIGGGSAFVTRAGYERATGTTGATLLRFQTTARTDAERAAILARIEAALAERGAAVRYAMPTPLLRSIIDDHVLLVTRAVIAMAAILALVGLLGLGSAMAINVAERTREIGIMKTLGASNARLAAIILGEAATIGALSAFLAIAVSLPITLLVIAKIAAGGFLAAPPFTLSVGALIAWPLVMIAGSVLASVPPARRAAKLTVAAAIAEV
jgi:putative ABC transport system permease protein